MHTLSEQRLLSQRSEAPRGVELPSGDELRSMLNGLEKSFSETFRNLLGPDNRRELGRIAESFTKEFNQVKDQFVSGLRRELPNIKNYFRLGGPYGSSAGRYRSETDDILTDLENRFRIPNRGRGFSSVSVENPDGTDFLEFYGDEEPSLPFEGDAYAVNLSGEMNALLDETRTINQRLSAERNRALNQSLAALDALRAEVEGGSATTPESTATTPETTATSGDRTNLQPRPGETREEQRARLERELADARTAFNAQKDVVDRLVAAGSATPADTLKAEREKLVKLEQDVVGLEGQITALRGERVEDNPQPR
jgi:hypothetical protein